MKKYRIWVLGCLLAASTARAAPPEYAITDLGPSDGWSSGAFAMNNRGWIVGATAARAWLRSPAGDVTTIETPPGYNGVAPSAISEDGIVVGRLGMRLGSVCFGATPPRQHAFIYRDGQLTDIPPPPGPPSAEGRPERRAWAVSVSSNGEVLMVADTPEGPVGSYLWRDGRYKAVEDGDDVDVVSNAAGVTAGVQSSDPRSGRRPYVRSGSRTDFLPLLDAGSGKPDGTVSGINASGVIIGSAMGADGKMHACSWKDGKITDLGGLMPVVTSIASGINPAGTIVGQSGIPPSVAPPNGTMHGVLWKNGRITDLNTLIPSDSGWTVTIALAITDRGQILARGKKDGEFRSCLLTPLR